MSVELDTDRAEHILEVVEWTIEERVNGRHGHDLDELGDDRGALVEALDAEEGDGLPSLLPEAKLEQLAAEPGPTVVSSDAGAMYRIEASRVPVGDEEADGE